MIRCSDCEQGTMIEGRVQDYDASAVVGLDAVVLRSAPALVCDRCGHVMFEGKVVEAVTHELARLVVRHGEDLRPDEIRLLREVIGMTQAELAERLGVSRATVNRWETGSDELRPATLEEPQRFGIGTLYRLRVSTSGNVEVLGGPEEVPAAAAPEGDAGAAPAAPDAAR
jgi:putative zinc finger/helix-turn-helix YgiT family protein